MKARGYFGIGIYHTKTAENVGTLWRTAHILGASYIFTIGRRYKKQSSDTTKATRHVPLFEYDTFDQFRANLPRECRIVAVELTEEATPLPSFKHPSQCVYLLGAEDHGLPAAVLERCHAAVVIPGERCLNVSVAGSIVLYDRVAKRMDHAAESPLIACGVA